MGRSRRTPVGHRWTGWLWVGLVVPLTGAVEPTDVWCEEAVAHLIDCCPDFDRHAISCVSRPWCSPPPPMLSRGESDCILAASCPEVQAADMCARLLARFPRVEPESDQPWPTVPPVCP